MRIPSLTRPLALAACAALLLAFAPAAARADMGRSSAPSTSRSARYDRAATLVKQRRYAEAVPLLKRVVRAQPRNADAYNLLGFATRKLGHPQDAISYYEKALRIDPGHRGAHEYLGEAYLELGQIDKAREHLAFLDQDCWMGCEELTDLKAAVARYEARRKP